MNGARRGVRVLLVDDDPKLRSLLETGLTKSGNTCVCAENGESALSAIKAAGYEPFDVVLLDVMMPGMSGWECLQRIRSSTSSPVIMVTAREAVAERVRGLRSGADDYIIKPFALAELLARIDVVVRRHDQAHVLECGPLRLDLVERSVVHEGEDVALSPKEFDLLKVLMEHQGETLQREVLLGQVWHLDFDPGTNLVDVHVGRLRRKLWRPGSPQIRTARGQGYSLCAPVERQ